MSADRQVFVYSLWWPASADSGETIKENGLRLPEIVTLRSQQ